MSGVKRLASAMPTQPMSERVLSFATIVMTGLMFGSFVVSLAESWYIVAY